VLQLGLLQLGMLQLGVRQFSMLQLSVLQLGVLQLGVASIPPLVPYNGIACCTHDLMTCHIPQAAAAIATKLNIFK
jgi:hypothetical protein